MPESLARYYGVPRIPIDKTTCEGAFDQPYEWPAARVAHKIVELPVPVGFWRSVGHSHQAFFTESFTDELAAAAGQDPIAFRAALLARHPRHLAVLKRRGRVVGLGASVDVMPPTARRARAASRCTRRSAASSRRWRRCRSGRASRFACIGWSV